MDFDKRTIFAFVLIGLILVLIQTDFYQKNFLPPQPAGVSSELDSVPEETKTASSAPERAPAIVEEQALHVASAPAQENKQTTLPVDAKVGQGERITVETDLYRAVFSTKGASLISWTLKNYSMFDSTQVQMIGQDGIGNLAVVLPTDEDTLDTSPYVFKVDKQRGLSLKPGQSGTLIFTLNLTPAKQIVKTFTFRPGSYAFDLDVRLKNLKRFVDGYSFYLAWQSGLASTEPDFKTDMNSAKVYALQGDLMKFDVKDDFVASDWDNPTDWVAMRTKYFALAIIPREKRALGLLVDGEQIDVGQAVPLKRYAFKLKMPFDNSNDFTTNYTIFLGPLDYEIIKSFNVNLENIMDLGWTLFRPFGKFVLWSFTLLHSVIPNYGWVIVIFSILVKILLFPLTRKSFQSMKEMQALQPLMQELNEKYKDDPQKKQQEVMKLYKEHGVNPLGGCIPMVLQMPLLIALFNVFRTTIGLRGAPFILWIHDLSRPDTIAHLPFALPLYGDTVNILPLFMGITMFIQQKMSMKDPKQKAMVYFMPLFMTLLFNSFPSGLNLYYALFNLFSILQDKLIPYKTKSLEEIKATSKDKPKKRRQKYDYRGRR